MLANDRDPVLDGDTIETLLASAQVRDANGRFPTEEAYEPTYDLRIAASRGWRLKAARVAADYDLNTDGHGMTRSQMIDQFIKMADAYGRLGAPHVRSLGEPRRLRGRRF